MGKYKIVITKLNLLPNERLESFWDALWLGIRTFLIFTLGATRSTLGSIGATLGHFGGTSGLVWGHIGMTLVHFGWTLTT